ncbi:DNA-directed RNA polymerase subunit K [Candidatus Micrarchaeota archaeon]|mgnify:CR=1 FL=1|nr:MAG: DNA-directed RNA polymerase subunit K [Candidatus Micrarchaeota archaeon]
MLTRFEKARVIGARALQISMGAPVLVKVPKGVKDPLKVVLAELRAGAIPLTVVRKLPNGDTIMIDIKGEDFGEAEI